jgi:hypothetical protein
MENFSVTYMRQNFGKNSLKIFDVSDLGADGLSGLWVLITYETLLSSHGDNAVSIFFSDTVLNFSVEQCWLIQHVFGFAKVA